MIETESMVVRSRVFVVLDGAFVVKWDEHQIQDLLTGQYRYFERRDFGAPITDFELNQLIQAGLVEHFNKEYVWLTPAEQRDALYLTNAQKKRLRAYYLNTTLAPMQLNPVEACLLRLGMDDEFETFLRDDFVMIWETGGQGFSNFDAAEEARAFLSNQVPDIFTHMVVGFIETTRRTA
ncbi:MAG: hypothetical protein H7Y11_09490 [Armatimonadetes bacterium]|nr:hypothetical protein [Anaerolineae bacterium]